MSIFKFFFGKKEPKKPEADLVDHLDYLKSLRLPAIALAASQTPSSSKLGGLPNLSNDIEWPSWRGAPMSFLCQIDLSDAKQELESKLPASGALYFFYNQEQETWGFDPDDKGSWCVIYSEDAISSTAERTAPEGLSDEHIYVTKHIKLKQVDVYPGGEDSRVDELNLSMDAFDEYYDIKAAAFGDEAEHHLLGYPSSVQGDHMDLECQLVTNGLYCGNASGYNDPLRVELEPGKKDWSLLLQLDTDDDAEMMWGDTGMLYFWIKKQDLEALRFENTWMILQCS